MLKWILLIFLPLNVFAEGGQIVPKWGFEKNIVKHGAGSGERLWGVEYIHPIGTNAKLKVEAGSWIAKQAGRRTSGYFAPSWGYRVTIMKMLYAEAFIGLGLITHTDTELGGHFQIFHDVNFGAIQNGWGLGLGFKHISSAGLSSPNRGRDFLTVRFMIDL